MASRSRESDATCRNTRPVTFAIRDILRLQGQPAWSTWSSTGNLTWTAETVVITGLVQMVHMVHVTIFLMVLPRGKGDGQDVTSFM